MGLVKWWGGGECEYGGWGWWLGGGDGEWRGSVENEGEKVFGGVSEGCE